MAQAETLREGKKNGYPWRLFFFLLFCSLLGVLAVLPYLSAVLASSTLTLKPLPLPLPILALIQGVTNFSIAIGLGLWFARKLGLGAPILEAWLYRRSSPPSSGLAAISCLTGIGLGLITLLLLRSSIGAPLASLPVATEGIMPLWKRFLACFYGGLCEEMLMRLFFLSFLLWLFGKCARISHPAHSPVIFWIANLVAALAFGAGHLPLAAHLVPLTFPVVTAVISLNAFVALGFGYLYRARGLEAAMLAHFAADLVLHVVGPML